MAQAGKYSGAKYSGKKGYAQYTTKKRLDFESEYQVVVPFPPFWNASWYMVLENDMVLFYST